MKVIILAGGSGTRLWPLSRERFPKQFIKFEQDGLSSFQRAFKRALMLSNIDDIYIVTNVMYKFLVMGAIEEIGYSHSECNVISEPFAKNTLPAVYAGVHKIRESNEDTVVVFSSDYIVSESECFPSIISKSKPLCNEAIIAFGLRTDSHVASLSYMLPGDAMHNGYLVRDFKRNPSKDDVLQLLLDECYMNTGIFMFNSKLFAEEVKALEPDIYNAFDLSKNIEEAFEKLESKVSMEVGILEKSQRVALVPIAINWDELSSFDSMCDLFEKDENLNILFSDNIIIESRNNYIHSEKNKLVAAVGVEDLIIIDNRDALLICHKDESQKVEMVVDELKKRGDKRVEYHIEDHRPWGNYKILDEEEGAFKIKRIRVGVGKRLSYQMHHHRSEHWIVASGMAKITIDDEDKMVASGESIFIRPGQKHRLENPGKVPLEIIEVQMGGYLEEDDIIRFDDEYGRT